MKVECPSCGHDHEVPADTVGEGGTRMRCSACSTSFTAFASGVTVRADGKSEAAPSEEETPSAGSGEAPFMNRNVFSEGSEGSPPIEEAPDLEEGAVLGDQFEVRGLLGKGAFAAVYRAGDLRLREEFALKAIPTFGEADEVVRLLGEEYRASRRVEDQTHVLRIERPQRCTHAGMEWALLPMELASGSFRDWLRGCSGEGVEERLEAGLPLFRQACRGVEALHEAGIAHLDLKPENLLLVEDEAFGSGWRVKVSDFGLARALEQGEVLHPRLQKDGIGTPWYMAPEQVFAARPKEVGREADIYALGVILFELADGDVPFEGETPEKVRQKHREAEPPSIEPVWVDAIAQQCLAKQKERRPEGAMALLRRTRPDPEEERAFEAAREEDTIAAYEAFLEEWPEGIWAPKAEGRIEEIEARRQWEARREELFQRCADGLEAGKLEAAEGALEELEDHLREEAAQDPEYQELKERVKERRRKRRREWEARREELVEEVEGRLGAGKLEAAEGQLEALESHLGEEAEGDEAYQSLADRVEAALEDRRRREKLGRELAQAREQIREAEFRTAGAHVERARSAFEEISDQREGDREKIEEVADRLESARETVQKHLPAAKEALEREEIPEAESRAEAVLEICPEAEEACQVRNEARTRQEKAQKALEQVEKALSKAAFEEAREALAEAENFWAGYPELEGVGEKIEREEKGYEQALRQAQNALEAQELDVVLDTTSSLLDHFPEADRPRNLKKKAEDEKQNANLALGRAKSAWKRADFEQAEEEIEKARQHWPGAEIEEATRELDRVRDGFQDCLEEAQSALEVGGFEVAREILNEAQEFCPEATSVQDLQKKIEAQEQEVKEVCSEAGQAVRFGDFEQALDILEEARSQWPENPDLNAEERETERKQEAFRSSLQHAEDEFEEGRLDQAEEMVREALEISARSPAAKRLKNKVEEKRLAKESRRKTLKWVARFAGLCILGAVLGIGSAIYSDWLLHAGESPYLFNITLLLLASLGFLVAGSVTEEREWWIISIMPFVASIASALLWASGFSLPNPLERTEVGLRLAVRENTEVVRMETEDLQEGWGTKQLKGTLYLLPIDREMVRTVSNYRVYRGDTDSTTLVHSLEKKYLEGSRTYVIVARWVGMYAKSELYFGFSESSEIINLVYGDQTVSPVKRPRSLIGGTRGGWQHGVVEFPNVWGDMGNSYGIRIDEYRLHAPEGSSVKSIDGGGSPKLSFTRSDIHFDRQMRKGNWTDELSSRYGIPSTNEFAPRELSAPSGSKVVNRLKGIVLDVVSRPNDTSS